DPGKDTARRGEVARLTVSTRKIAAALGQAIAQRIGEPRYKLWFENHTKFSWDEGVLTVGVPNRHFEEWLQKTFVGAVRDAAGEVFGEAMQVRFVIDPELFQATPEFWYCWRFQIPALAAAGFRVLVPDLRGYNLPD